MLEAEEAIEKELVTAEPENLIENEMETMKGELK